MRKILLILFYLICNNINAQENDFYGIWYPIEIYEERFYMDSSKQFHLTKIGKKIYKSEKEALKNFEQRYSENQFVFNTDNSFQVNLSKNPLIKMFEGKFEINTNNNKLNLIFNNNALNKYDYYFNYKFEKNLLILEVHFGGSPTIYKLKKE